MWRLDPYFDQSLTSRDFEVVIIKTCAEWVRYFQIFKVYIINNRPPGDAEKPFLDFGQDCSGTPPPNTESAHQNKLQVNGFHIVMSHDSMASLNNCNFLMSFPHVAPTYRPPTAIICTWKFGFLEMRMKLKVWIFDQKILEVAINSFQIWIRVNSIWV